MRRETLRMRMDTRFTAIAFIGLVLCAVDARAAIYTGSWQNTTFGSTGPLTLTLELTPATFDATLDLDGMVFGLADPPALQLIGARDPNGGASIELTDHPLLGDLSGTVTAEGLIDVTFSDIPGGFIQGVQVDGQISPTELIGTYRVEFNTPAPPELRQEGLDFALGTFSAAVPEPGSVLLLGLGAATIMLRRRGRCCGRL